MFPGNRENVLALALAVLVLTVLGVVMLFSTGTFSAGADPGDLYFDVKRQVFWLVLGVPLAIYAALVDLDLVRRITWVLFGLAVVLLLLCFVPGDRPGDQRRTALDRARAALPTLGMAKLALVLALATWYGRERDPGRMGRISVSGAPGRGGSRARGLGGRYRNRRRPRGHGFAVFHAAGVNRRWLMGGALAAVTGFVLLVLLVPGRMERVWAVLQPERYAQGVGLQQHIAEVALGSGGLDGMGLGAGRMKMLYMPFAHTDFVFPMIGEELGLGGTLLVVASFAVFALSGLAIAQNASDRFSQVLAVGLTTMITGQALLNIAVTTGTFPEHGLAVAFCQLRGIQSGGVARGHRAPHQSGPPPNPCRRRIRDRGGRPIRNPRLPDFDFMENSILPPLHSPGVLIACGGTGGHFFPGHRRGRSPDAPRARSDLRHFGEGDRSIAAAAYPHYRFETIPSFAMPKPLSPQMIPFLLAFSRAVGLCQKWIREIGAKAVLGMGGFTSTAPLVAARTSGCASFIHESNAIPGRANLLNAKFADYALVGWDACQRYFPERKTKVVGTPVRPSVATGESPAEARAWFLLDPDRFTVMVMGGSQGATGSTTR